MDSIKNELQCINAQLYYLNTYIYDKYQIVLDEHGKKNIPGNFRNSILNSQKNKFYFQTQGEYLNENKKPIINYPTEEEINNILKIVKENELIKLDTINYTKLEEILTKNNDLNNVKLKELFTDIKVSEEITFDNNEIIEVIEKGNKTTNLLLSLLIGALIITTFFKNVFR